MMTKFFYSFVFGFFLVRVVRCKVTCDSVGSCACELSNGDGTYDLSSLNNWGYPPLYSNIGIDGQSDATFSFDPCRKFPCGQAQAHVCLNDKSSAQLAYGVDLSFEYDESSKIVTFLYSNEVHGSTLSTAIALHCEDNQAGKGILNTFSQVTSTSSFASSLDSKYACPQRSKHSNKLSTGTVLCILLLVGIFIYIVGGMLINKYVRKVEGSLFPNLEFWKDFPTIVKDGCVFFISKLPLRRKQDEYQQI